jgi:hypothetical protein
MTAIYSEVRINNKLEGSTDQNFHVTEYLGDWTTIYYGTFTMWRSRVGRALIYELSALQTDFLWEQTERSQNEGVDVQLEP